MVKHLSTEGTVLVPPNRPFAFAMVLHYLLWNYCSKGAAVVQKER